MESFDNIHLDLSKQPGKCRFAESGLGWKPSAGGDTFTLDGTNITSAIWSRASKGYEVKVFTRTGDVIQLDGFAQEDLDRLIKCFKHWYTVSLEHKEHALRGWNWGKTEFQKSELTFNVQSRPAFEIPYSEISNTNLAGKNEVAVELSAPLNEADTGTNGDLGGARGKGKKMGGARDQLVEMRFYIPGTITKTEKKEDAEGEEDGEEEQEQNAANLFYDTLMDKAEIGEVAGDTIATFLDIMHLTPRGRFDIDMYEESFRLRGKTYDYKIRYDHIKKFMLLPKPDDTHTLIVVGLDPPLRQGQTRYPFLVMQFKRDEEVSIDLNMTDEDFDQKYKGKLQPHYEMPTAAVIAQIFRGLSAKKIITPSKEFSSHHQQSGIKCWIKGNEGHLFCLDKSFMFVPKPATYISFDNVSVVTLSGGGGATGASARRTFDVAVSLKKNEGEHSFNNIPREELPHLEDFLRSKKIKFKNSMADDSALIAAALNDRDLASSDDEMAVARGSADEDDESIDEDFQADSESDVAEEYDEDHQSDSDSDEDMADASGDDEAEARPKKKAKTGK